MQFDVKNFPMLPREAENPTRPISSDKLLQPLTNSAFAPKLGDEYVFDVFDENGNIMAVEQDITNSTYTSIHIACTRNGKPSWIAQGQLIRVDADLNPTCPFCAEMRAVSTVGDLFNKIKNKKVKVVEMANKTFTNFGTTTRVERLTPIFKFVN